MTDSASFLSTQFLPTFIDAYRNHPCLWQVSSPEYNNRATKAAAYKDLIQLSKKTVPNCDLNFIKKKIEILRGSFRRECRKVKEFSKPGSKRDSTYKPKLWYYNLLLFLKGQEEMGQSTVPEETVDQDLQEVETYTEGEEEEDTKFETGALYTSTIAPTFMQRKRHRYKNEEMTENHQDELSFVQNHQEDEFDKFGAVVAAKLRRMTPVQEICAENLINQVLFNGMMDRLHESSKILLHDPQLYNG